MSDGGTSTEVRTRDYALVTAGYWAFTLTDGALRMLVLLHFHDLGYSPVSIAFLFLAYEFMGVITNLMGGWVGSRTGLQRTLVVGLGLQIVALLALTGQQTDWATWLSVTYVMAAQALSGVAKDLTKMSSKSAVKAIAGSGAGAGGLFGLVAMLTGSKNALKGVGFFLGALLLSWLGYNRSLVAMAVLIGVVLIVVSALLTGDIGRAKRKTPIRSLLSKSAAINRLSAARFFLFGARDIWFVVALPVFLSGDLGWSFQGTGAFLALWVIGYGIIQSATPAVLRYTGGSGNKSRAARRWATILLLVTATMATATTVDGLDGDRGALAAIIIVGLLLFGAVFAVNSSLHSYLIVAFAGDDAVALDVGFYYSANAAGRLAGTLLSGVLYLVGGIEASLWGSTLFLIACRLLTSALPTVSAAQAEQAALET